MGMGMDLVAYVAKARARGDRDGTPAPRCPAGGKGAGRAVAAARADALRLPPETPLEYVAVATGPPHRRTWDETAATCCSRSRRSHPMSVVSARRRHAPQSSLTVTASAMVNRPPGSSGVVGSPRTTTCLPNLGASGRPTSRLSHMRSRCLRRSGSGWSV